MNYRCYFTFEEFCEAFEKHKETIRNEKCLGSPSFTNDKDLSRNQGNLTIKELEVI